ncbi:TPA: DUF1311 domain-containing protein [Citrobacter braakii]|uniref:DUF1311 domain-containing protein n=1 Tax=Kluyvera ascorbata TaxID=51288 RepID=A0A3N2S4W1_9ENTR|nr:MULTISPECIES: lysozyme inhibitor LprI family protein [Enterobacteriaceae]MDM2924365.1 lysozyme inhibitor LprI family protein [Citrobacter sp. Cpa228]ROU14753.1 DUF1311 domain-containing protein [Kluyvera ascorbata]WFW91938.1 lysozyme inhibitor LprI family protein [Citrobacter freundii]HEC1249229.1 DUF1311 domain-containing protein [Citrobacter braakii]
MKKITLILPMAIILAGCGEKNIECSSDVSKDTVIDIIRDSSTNNLNGFFKRNNIINDFSDKLKKSTLDDLDFDVSEVTTIKKDPNSNIRECEAVVSINVSPSEFNKLKLEYRNYFSNGDLDSLIGRNGLKNNSGIISTTVYYTVKPTDDKENVYVTVTESDRLSYVSGFISFLQIAEKKLEEKIAEQERIQKVQAEQQAQREAERQAQQQERERVYKEQLQAEQAQQQENERVYKEQLQADQALREAEQAQREVEQAQQQQPTGGQEVAPTPPKEETVSTAKSKFIISDQELNKNWRALDPTAKKNLLNEQRQWLKNKDMTCGKVDMQATDSMTIKMFNCQSEWTQKRAAELLNIH